MNLLYLSALAFVFISTTAISLSYKYQFDVKKFFDTKNIEKLFSFKYSDLPVLNSDATFPILSAQSAMAVDLKSGVTLYEKDPLRKLLPASTTKIMTALVVLDEYDLNEVVEVKKVLREGQSMGLSVGEKITVKDLLSGLLIYSANDAAEVLAFIHPMGRDHFIDLMNQKANFLGLTNTHFSNPTGLDNGSQYSTVRDLIAVSRYAMQNPVFSEIVGTKKKEITSVNGNKHYQLTNTNELLGVVDGVAGVKTGWTENARENLVTYIRKDDKEIMIAVLGSQDRFGETKELIDWIFDNFVWQEVKYSYSP